MDKMKRQNLMGAAKALIAGLIAVPAIALASSGGVHLDQAKYDLNDKASLQRGAKAFVTYCLNCHSAASMRYNRLMDLGLTEKQIKDEYITTDKKVGELMTIAMDAKAAKEWFGATPPDLSVIARSRGADWLYTYLRGFYRDSERPTGWNNVAFPAVGMPHVLAGLQGEQILQKAGKDDAGKLVLAKPGAMAPAEYDKLANDLVGYLVYMGEPAQTSRVKIGFFVIGFLILFTILAYALKKEYWKDVH
jgi:ubiquinol-cytochrome c reductase cytochrome c1 subunit